MRFIPIDLVLPSVADEAHSGRHRGIHVSGLVKHLLLQLDPKKYADAADDATRLLWEMGLAWEDMALSKAFWHRILRRTYPKCSFKQVQTSLDRIWGTCDMLSLNDGITIDHDLITESKLTQISMVNEIMGAKFWSWRVQMMAYCRMWGTKRALLPVCFLNGDYRPKRIVPLAWDVRFKQSEIDANWDMLLQARDEHGKGESCPTCYPKAA